MSSLIMYGHPVADRFKELIRSRIASTKVRGTLVKLAIVLVGDDPASHAYAGRLVRLLGELGGFAETICLKESASETEVLAVIERLNLDSSVTGILPMMPMPAHINDAKIGAAIAPLKDVDCLSPLVMGEVFMGTSSYAACTARACMAALEFYDIRLAGKSAAVVGRSNVVGKPLALMLLNKNATVTICHSHTVNLPDILSRADIVVAAVGKPGLITGSMVKEGAVLLDVGTNFVDGMMVGDIAPEAYKKASAYTPVPGGIGVISNMMVMDCLTRNM